MSKECCAVSQLLEQGDEPAELTGRVGRLRGEQPDTTLVMACRTGPADHTRQSKPTKQSLPEGAPACQRACEEQQVEMRTEESAGARLHGEGNGTGNAALAQALGHCPNLKPKTVLCQQRLTWSKPSCAYRGWQVSSQAKACSRAGWALSSPAGAAQPLLAVSAAAQLANGLHATGGTGQ